MCSCGPVTAPQPRQAGNHGRAATTAHRPAVRPSRTGVSTMGMLKRMKDMRDMVEAAPGMVQQAQQLGAQAQQMAAAQQAAMQAQYQAGGYQGATNQGVPNQGVPNQGVPNQGVPNQGAAPGGADFEPIAGVSLDQYVAVSKGVAAYGYDQSKLVDVAAAEGIAAVAWDMAYRGWNERIQRNPAVAQRFNQIYRER